MTEQEIMKLAFNQGYNLQKGDPELAVKIASSFSDASIPYADGFICGAIEYMKEIELNPEVYLNEIRKSISQEKYR